MQYFDHAATTPVRREVLEAMWPYLTGDFGNPSSTHELGERAAHALADARTRVASAFGARAAEVVFTSGGTEADNLAIKGISLANPRGRHLITTRIEHEAVLESCDYLHRLHGFEVSFVDTDRSGRVDLDSFRALLRPDTSLVTIMFANNEIGTVQPIPEIVQIAHAIGVPVHTDAVQAAGWLTLDQRVIGADAISISGHKLGAPKGIGALYIRGRIPLEPLLHGGGQERGARSGTENVAGAVALATALDLAKQEAGGLTELAARRDAFIRTVLQIPGMQLTGHPEDRLPQHASFCCLGVSGEAVLLELERRGVVISSGSACAAGRDEPSHVLTALGYDPDLARTALRFTFGTDATGDQLAEAAQAVREAVGVVRGGS